MTHPQPSPDAGAQYGPNAQYASNAQYVPLSPQQPAGRPGKSLVIAALVLAGVSFLAGASSGIVSFLILREGANYHLVGIVSTVAGVISGLLALGAVGFGIASLLRRESPRVLAGAAIGVAVAGLLGLLLAGTQQLLYLTL